MSGSITVTLKGKDKPVLNVGGGGSVTLGAGKAQGTAYYPALIDKPSIEGITLVNNKTFKELGMEAATVAEIERILYLD